MIFDNRSQHPEKVAVAKIRFHRVAPFANEPHILGIIRATWVDPVNGYVEPSVGVGFMCHSKPRQ
ncbi:uncharacterized protein METZ01_LOCUS122985, partial [marine metagenome]